MATKEQIEQLKKMKAISEKLKKVSEGVKAAHAKAKPSLKVNGASELQSLSKEAQALKKEMADEE